MSLTVAEMPFKSDEKSLTFEGQGGRKVVFAFKMLRTGIGILSNMKKIIQK